jgi:hypothetical protein
MESKKLNLKKQCVICYKQINTKIERYVKLLDFNGKKQEAECVYHLDCWKDRFNIQRKKAMKEYLKPMMEQMTKIAGEIEQC